jgi:AraC-like DNA-binding protein
MEGVQMSGRFEIEFDSSELPASHRLRRWQDLVGDHLADVDMSRPKNVSADRAYSGSMSLRACESATFAHVQSADQLLLRTPQRVRHAERETVLLNVMIAGECHVEQEGRRALLRPGDLCLYESVRPYHIATPGSFEVLVVMADRRKIEASFGDLRLFTGIPIANTTPVGAIAGQYWRSLAANALALNEAELGPLVETGFDIVRTALGSLVSSTNTQAPSSTFALQRAKIFMQQTFHRFDLSPDEIAQASGLSLRRLQELFQAEGSSIMGYLRDLRLAMARRYLSDPVFARQSIGIVMGSSGFIDQSQFARAFRKAYGLSPRDFRNGQNP